jgi:uncharacterized membrane protein YcaP (DUF421 family)
MIESMLGLDWGKLFAFNVSPAEIVVRGTVFYWFLFLLFRFIIRREIGSVGVGDILVLVIIADASQNAMAGEYNSISEGMVLVSTLIFWNVLIDWLSYRFPRFHRFAQPEPLPLVRHGRILRRNMRKEFINDEELWNKLREQGIESLDEVKIARLEADGEISVIRQE